MPVKSVVSASLSIETLNSEISFRKTMFTTLFFKHILTFSLKRFLQFEN